MGKLIVIRSRDAERLRVAESADGSILLLQDGVYLAENPIRGKVYASAVDAEKRGVKQRLRDTKLVSYAEIVGLLLEQGNTVVNL